jgi:hypothetical protein
MRTFLAILLFCSLQSSYAQKKIYIIGSSTSACVGPTNINDCYVSRLSAFYNQLAPLDTTVTTIAASGYNCYRGMPTGYIPPYSGAEFQPNPAANITYALSNNPDVILVNYPSNAYEFLPYDSIMYCLRTIKETANAAGKVCYITTSQPRTQFNAAARARLKVVRDSVMNAFGYFALNFWDGLTDPNDLSILPAYRVAGDDIHLNGAGHQLLFQRVQEKQVFNIGLPAQFVNFEAQFKNGQTIVKWMTTQEQNLINYIIERSNDGVVFKTLQIVAAKNSNQVSSYSVTDAQPLNGWNYFRIVTIDKDGTKKLTPVFKVFAATQKLSLQKIVAAGNQLQLQLLNKTALTATIELVNAGGAVVAIQQFNLNSGLVTASVNISNLTNGIYYARIITTEQAPIIKSFVKN